MAEFGSVGVGEMVDQMRESQREIEAVKDALPELIDEGVKDTAEDLEDQMRSNAPKDTGRLQESIEARSFSEGWMVGPRGVDYAKYVEYGTAPHTITPDGLSVTDIESLAAESRVLGTLSPDTLDAPSLKFEGQHAFWAQHPGTTAQPFFRPAVNEARENDWLLENIEEHTMPLLQRVVE